MRRMRRCIMARSTLARVGLAAALAIVYVTSVAIGSEKSASAMATAAKAWLASVTAEQREQAAMPFDAADRTAWHYVPNEMFPRKGVTLGTMTDSQKALARDLLKTGMSQRGYMTTEQIMELEKVLQVIEGDKRRFPRDPGAYALAVFGTPGGSSPWGWRFVGHHISFHFTIVGGRTVGNTPTFLGSNPAEVRDGPQKGQRTLGNEEDAARALLDALDSSERSVAIVQTTAPNEMLRAMRAALLAIAVLLCPAIGWAHPVPFSYADLHLAGGAIDAAIVLHVYDVAHDLRVEPAERLLDLRTAEGQRAALEALLRARMQLAADDRQLTPVFGAIDVLPERSSLRVQVRWPLDRSPGRLTVTAVLFPYDPAHQTFVNIYERGRLTSQAILDARRSSYEYFAGSRQGTWAVVRKFLPAGVHHILIGPDHLLFLIGLLLLGGNLRKLTLIVTAFTLAHSVT